MSQQLITQFLPGTNQCFTPNRNKAIEVRELSRVQKHAALYVLAYPDGHQTWRIARPVRDRDEIPTSLLPEFTNENDARRTFTKLVN
jgi:hypothetical protein